MLTSIQSDSFVITKKYTNLFIQKYCILKENSSDIIFHAAISIWQSLVRTKVNVYSNGGEPRIIFSVCGKVFAIPEVYVVRDADNLAIGYIKHPLVSFGGMWNIEDIHNKQIGFLKENFLSNIKENFWFIYLHYFYRFSFFVDNQDVGDIVIEGWFLSKTITINLSADKRGRIDRRMALAFAFILDRYYPEGP